MFYVTVGKLGHSNFAVLLMASKQVSIEAPHFELACTVKDNRKVKVIIVKTILLKSKKLLKKVSEGVIDSGYTGSVVVKLHSLGSEGHRIDKGDKIAQIVFLPVFMPVLHQVDSLDESERGSNGFGSTGKRLDDGWLWRVQHGCPYRLEE